MKARDLMTWGAITVEPDESVARAVRLMLQNKISGLPVVDDKGQLVGIVTEGDFLRRGELGTQRQRPRWLEFLLGPGRLASEYVQASGQKVRQVMTSEAQTITPETPLHEIVRLMERHRVKRLPVVMLAERNRVTDVERARKSGVDEFMTRPFNTAALLARIESVTTQRREFIESNALGVRNLDV